MPNNTVAKRKIFIIATVISAVFLLLLTAIFIIGTFGVQGGGLKAFLSNCISAGVHWVILIFLAGLVGIILIIALLSILLPLVFFFFGKLWTRITLRGICKRKKYSYTVKRAPFASRKEGAKNADVEIGMEGKTLNIHFVDVPLSLINVLVFLHDREYRIFSTTRGKIVKRGGGAPINMSGQGTHVLLEGERNVSENYKSYRIPEFAPKNPEFHIFVAEPKLARVKYIRDNELVDISAEVPIGNIIVCKATTLKKRLKGKLHSTLE